MTAQYSMSQLRIALAQVNPIVGDLRGNGSLVLQEVEKAKQAGAHLVLFPEMVLTGYPVEDLALRPSFRVASMQALHNLATALEGSGCGEIAVVVGHLAGADRPLNALSVLHRGSVVAHYIKRNLPNYGVFDEFRNFVSGEQSMVFRFKGVDIALAICEDIWHPIPDLVSRNVGVLLVANGSPFERDKDDVRLTLARQRAQEIGAPLVYVNMVGGQDDLVFDGDSLVVNAAGELVARAPQFLEGTMLVDLDVKVASSNPDVIVDTELLSSYQRIIPGIASRLDDYEEVWQALVVGLRDYVEKNGFPSVILGLSGGIDSAVVAALAVDAVGAKRTFGVSLPSRYSSAHSIEDAKELALRTGLHYRVIDIAPMVDSFVSTLRLHGIAEENVQARVRGTTLMGLSNQDGHLVLATGNKSELAVGYSTLYGDAVGGYAPIKDLFKTDVWNLARWRNDDALRRGERAPIPENSITKEPSAELRPDQRDRDSLPDYSVLDAMLRIYVEGAGSVEAVVAAGFSQELADWTIQMVDRAEYKRRQYPPGPKVSSRAFGKDRRLPITSHWREKH